MTTVLIHSAGPGVSLQDGGRRGYLRFGVTHAGPMDALAHALANIAVGNDRDATAIEVSLGGLEISSLSAAVDVAVVGGGFVVTRDGKLVATPCRLTLRTGERLRIAAGETGSWCYVAIAAKFEVPRVLGSQATHTRSGFGGINGRCLAGGDRIEVTGTKSFCGPEGRLIAPWLARAEQTIRVIPGPQRNYFDDDQYRAFLDGPWEVSARSDRMAVFVDGPHLRHNQGYDIVSDGVVMGSIQVPGNGLPIVLMADSQSTGGYPKIATVIGADLGALAQIRPGNTINFVSVSLDEALQARASLENELAAPVEIEAFVRTEFPTEFVAAIDWTDGVVASTPEQNDSGESPHASGRLTMPERLSLLFDETAYKGSEHGGVVTAEGEIYGQRALAFARSPDLAGGTVGRVEVRALCRLRDMARQRRLPLIGLYDDTVANSSCEGEAVEALALMAGHRNRAENLEIAIVFGQCLGVDAVSVSLSDIVLTAGVDAGVSLIGPRLTRRISNEIVAFSDLSRAEEVTSSHYEDEVSGILALRRLVSMLSDHGKRRFPDPEDRLSPGLDGIEAGARYDMREVIRSVADHGDAFELRPSQTCGLLTTLIRLGGRPCGVVASQPLVNAGLAGAEEMNKAGDFIALCDRHNVPMVWFWDTPGLRAGKFDAHARSLSAYARLLSVVSQAAFPGIFVATGTPSPFSALAMWSSFFADGRRFCWPRAVAEFNPAQASVGNSCHDRFDLITPSQTRANVIEALRAMTTAGK
ncbi:5-oxoprolinase/urea amidolyase family protein [Rhizobium sp. AG207R]|uniref:5-oxoprolinase/urea amidolyase family protein n=1 Tax=Rhizobium sp. AG207R TaxID=2802287 RepID=UPI0022AC2546|nr:5-oxoprolinase/urea amidolyase family protein [Rhizobium sp. AG207R]MCZ3378418.1 5-oxoprolinase/urea amidolyase family protein [Rhizobium sp. AG207R]